MFCDFGLKADEMVDVFGVFRGGDGEAFFGEIVETRASTLGKTADEGGFFGGEVEDPGVGGVEVVGFEAIGPIKPIGGVFSVLGLDPDKDGTFGLR